MARLDNILPPRLNERPIVRVLLIIPALNEAVALAALLVEVRNLAVPEGVQVDAVVIDDGSTDATAEVATKAGFTVLRLCKNLGIGGAVQAGIKLALGRGHDCAIQVDGDGQHPPSEALKLVTALQANPDAALIVGSRYTRREGFQSTLMRRLGAAWLSWVLRILAGVRCSDPTSGLRLYARPALRLFDLSYPYDYPEPESLAMAAGAQLKIQEEPVQMRDRQGGHSSIFGLSAVYYMIKVTLAIAFATLRPTSTIRR